MSEQDKVATIPAAKAPVRFGQDGIEITTLDEAFRFAQYVVAGGFAPKGLERPEAVLIAVQMGREIGFSPMSSLQNIAVINGRPGIFGDAALAIIRAKGVMESYAQRWEGEGDNRKAIVTVKRKGDAEASSQSFSVADAKKAGLWGTNVWAKYPDRMLLFRARGFILRDMFGDVLKGFKTAEELEDLPRDITGQVTVGAPSSLQGTAKPQPEAPAAAPAPEQDKPKRTRLNRKAENDAKGQAPKAPAAAEGTKTPESKGDAPKGQGNLFLDA